MLPLRTIRKKDSISNIKEQNKITYRKHGLRDLDSSAVYLGKINQCTATFLFRVCANASYQVMNSYSRKIAWA